MMIAEKKKKKKRLENDELVGMYPKFDFTVDEGEGRLDPSRDKNQGKHRRRKVEKSCVIFLLCDLGWCVHKSDVQNKWDDTHTHAHTLYPPAFTLFSLEALTNYLYPYLKYGRKREPDMERHKSSEPSDHQHNPGGECRNMWFGWKLRRGGFKTGRKI